VPRCEKIPTSFLVGELRDLETVSIAIETAETGPPRVRHAAHDDGRRNDRPHHRSVPADRQSQIRVMLAESLKGVISQTLCKKIGGGRVAGSRGACSRSPP
jgi:twitching motility protein PilT